MTKREIAWNAFAEDLGNDILAVDKDGHVLGRAADEETLRNSFKAQLDQGQDIAFLGDRDIKWQGEPPKEKAPRITTTDPGVGDEKAQTAPANRQQPFPAETSSPQPDPAETATAKDKAGQDKKNDDSQKGQPDPAGDGSTAGQPGSDPNTKHLGENNDKAENPPRPTTGKAPAAGSKKTDK